MNLLYKNDLRNFIIRLNYFLYEINYIKGKNKI
jgi:hypothetical protein